MSQITLKHLLEIVDDANLPLLTDDALSEADELTNEASSNGPKIVIGQDELVRIKNAIAAEIASREQNSRN